MERPLSPFMFPTWYRFQITSGLSILHRLTGIWLAVGSILLAWWLIAVAAGGHVFAATHAFLASPIGVLLLFLWSVAFFYHLCNGIRHLAWDARLGLRYPNGPSQRLRRARGDGRVDRCRLARCMADLTEAAMANTRSLPNATALRDENVLRRVRHLGSARDGLREWRLQRHTALALIPLGLTSSPRCSGSRYRTN